MTSIYLSVSPSMVLALGLLEGCFLGETSGLSLEWRRPLQTKDLLGPSKPPALMVGCLGVSGGMKPWSPPQHDLHTPGLLKAQGQAIRSVPSTY